MTDSSSDIDTGEIEAIADMAGELIHTKMEMAKKDTQMTHVMRIGTFHMELVPDQDINVEKIFNEMLNKLMKKYGEKLLEINVQQVNNEGKGNDRRQYA
tara:strand:+ start:101 stop:397 length:297 start_codon:yes stop_codon:yes gene_type:complete